mmetsp:Transcript_1915/g.4253  ORF Transcript_1915/g.4253 Transcript_1915/m.4253 type:complete len:220 (-) Transcript_1915:699-1358(-)
MPVPQLHACPPAATCAPPLSPSLHLAELRHHAHTNGLVEGSAHKQPFLVRRPVECADRLRGEVPVCQHLHAACNPQLVTLVVLDLALVRVVVPVEVQRAVTAADHADLAVLGQVVHAPHGGPSTHTLSQAGKALLGVVCACVKHVELGLQAAHHELVHLNILAVKLDATHAVLHVGLPAHLVHPQVKHLDVPVVIPCQHTALLVVVRVPERHAPAVPNV